MLSQITIPVYIMFGLQFILIPFQLISYFSRRSDKKRIRFLTLTVIYVLFNILWITNSIGLRFNLLSEISLFIIGLITIGYSCFYWLKEFDLTLTHKKAKLVLFHFSVILVLQSLTVYTGFFQYFWCYFALILYSEIVAIYFVRDIFRAFKKNSKAELNSLSYSILIASVIACFTPLVLFFIESFTIEYIAINSGFFFIASAYLRQYVLNRQTEWSLMDQFVNNDSEQAQHDEYIKERIRQYSTLTPREVEVAQLMFQNLMWKEISGLLKIEESTARKHGANIYAKFNVSRLEDFQSVLKEISSHILHKH